MSGRNALAPVLLGIALAGCNGAGPTEEGDRPFEGDRSAEVVPAEQAIGTPNIAQTDPEAMNAAEVSRLIGEGRRCGFYFTEAGRPVLVVALPERGGWPAQGGIKIHNELVELRSEQTADPAAVIAGPTMVAPGMTARIGGIEPDTEEVATGAVQREANLTFLLDRGLRADYRGFWRCGPPDAPERD